MPIAVSSAISKSDTVTLFTSKDDFDSWLDGITVPDATTSARGVVLKGVAVADVSSSTTGNNTTTINALLASLRTAGVITT
jgi:hypothetical protein|tara:strand:+ start:1731 stop:1973 length:243 start_codon:yes stop_codon:yes gene_type:complete